MPNPTQPSAEQLTRQIRQQLDSLRAAGVEWLPRAVMAGPPATTGDPAPVATSLFEKAEPDVSTAPAETAGQLSPQERRRGLEVLAEQVSSCTRCAELARARKNTVFGVGKIEPELCFIGEAPGADEDATGEPFVGAAGQLLNRIIAACGMKREEVYICNIIKCRPPGNRTPLPNEAANCRDYLDEQLELLQPKFICCLGACAAQNLLNTKLSIGRLRGQFQQYRGIPVLCTYHPAYLLRNPASKRDVWDDMKKLMARMGRAVP